MKKTGKKKDIDVNSLPLRIVIGKWRWVWIGRYNRVRELRRDHFDYVIIYNAFYIRHWGTSTGLGQLENGPTKQTVLDPCPNIRIHETNVVATYEVNQEAWTAFFDNRLSYMLKKDD
jgi:hypothetical protein